jgi:hypothetical protein
LAELEERIKTIAAMKKMPREGNAFCIFSLLFAASLVNS